MNTNIKERFAAAVAGHDSLRSFAFFSANLQKLSPQVPYEQHPALFLKANHYAKLTLDDERNIRWANTFELPEGFLQGMSAPGIIASFHTGPYRLLCMWLARLGIPLTIVIAADVAQRQSERNQRAYHEVTGNTTVNGYEYLFADDPMILRKMIGALKRGRFLVFYVDGNMGVGKNTKSRNTIAMDFMAHQLRVKTGVAELARLMRVPIYPILAHFDDRDQPAFHRFETIAPSWWRDGDHATCVANGIAQLYGHLHTVVDQYPMQWEGWFYIHHDLVHGQTGGSSGLFRYYLPFRIADSCFLLHKESFSAVAVPQEVYLQLKQRV